MNILVLAPQWPDPPRQGAAIRNLQILLYLSQRHAVTLLTFEPDGPVDRSRLESACNRIEIVPRPERGRLQRLRALARSRLPDMALRLESDAMLRRVEEIAGSVDFDAIHVEGIEMARYGFAAMEAQRSKHGSKAPRLTYDAHNAEYLLQRRVFTTDLRNPRRLPRSLYSLVQWWRLRRFERELCLASANIIAVSSADQTALKRLAPLIAPRLLLLPNGVDPAYWSRDAVEAKPVQEDVRALVFDGTMDFRPNVDAVLWFAEKVWPAIRRENPDVQFYIVGRNPSPQVLSLLKNPGITVTGAVDDTRPWVAGATLYVVPMRMGGGVRLKVLQAMSMGCAVVSTPMGADGIAVRDRTDLVLAREPSEFARQVNLLLADPARRKELGTSARERVTTLYAWSTLLPLLDSVYPHRASTTHEII
ncbi:MAG TPA: glycosyltransferase family 4 protein [Chloroflexia bacterium]|nr:glycosyltransferase family 4 protein [Chloroflexia bacterium]